VPVPRWAGKTWAEDGGELINELEHVNVPPRSLELRFAHLRFQVEPSYLPSIKSVRFAKPLTLRETLEILIYAPRQ
jgi:hypothetical protein